MLYLANWKPTQECIQDGGSQSASACGRHGTPIAVVSATERYQISINLEQLHTNTRRTHIICTKGVRAPSNRFLAVVVFVPLLRNMPSIDWTMHRVLMGQKICAQVWVCVLCVVPLCQTAKTSSLLLERHMHIHHISCECVWGGDCVVCMFALAVLAAGSKSYTPKKTTTHIIEVPFSSWNSVYI